MLLSWTVLSSAVTRHPRPTRLEIKRNTIKLWNKLENIKQTRNRKHRRAAAKPRMRKTPNAGFEHSIAKADFTEFPKGEFISF